jgi:hypothetical protein
MPTSLQYLRLMNVLQTALSARGLLQSYAAITNLQKYETTAKKLAEWSSEAEHQLHKTRTTQTSGAIAVLTSFLAALILSLTPTTLPGGIRFCASPLLLLGTLFARNHIKNYWAPKDGRTVGTRVPLPKMEDYNEAQRQTQQLLETLEYLEYGWVVSSFVAGMLGWK